MLDPSSPVVCQIPDCATTQAEIEVELRGFLNGYCSICKKERLGKLCGCAFPCSLTFRAQMCTKIHQLLGIQKPPERRAIQVCFKHPDLLKQAREACVAKRDQHLLSKAKGRSPAASTAAPLNSGQKPPVASEPHRPIRVAQAQASPHRQELHFSNPMPSVSNVPSLDVPALPTTSLTASAPTTPTSGHGSDPHAEPTVLVDKGPTIPSRPFSGPTGSTLGDEIAGSSQISAPATPLLTNDPGSNSNSPTKLMKIEFGSMFTLGSAGASEPLDPNGGQKFGILSASEDVVDLTEVVGATVGESSPQKVPSAVEPSKTTPSERDPESGPNDCTASIGESPPCETSSLGSDNPNPAPATTKLTCPSPIKTSSIKPGKDVNSKAAEAEKESREKVRNKELDELEQEIGCAAAGPSEGVEVNNCNPLEPPEIVDHGQDEISESEEESEDEDDYDETDKEDSSLKEITEGGKVLKVKYKNYQSTILKQGLKNLMNRNMYKDVTIHCKAGSIDTNRLLLASMSPYLESILSDVPVLDPMITILMKDIRVQDMEIFNLFLFNDLFVAHANKKDLRIVRKIAKLFKIDPLRLPTLKETEENVTKGSKDGSRKSVRSSSKNSGGKINERTARNFSKTNVRTPKENNTKKVMPESPLTRKRGRKAYEALPPPKRGRVASSKTSRSGVKLDQDESKISPSRMPLLSKGTRTRGRKRISEEDLSPQPHTDVPIQSSPPPSGLKGRRKKSSKQQAGDADVTLQSPAREATEKKEDKTKEKPKTNADVASSESNQNDTAPSVSENEPSSWDSEENATPSETAPSQEIVTEQRPPAQLLQQDEDSPHGPAAEPPPSFSAKDQGQSGGGVGDAVPPPSLATAAKSSDENVHDISKEPILELKTGQGDEEMKAEEKAAERKVGEQDTPNSGDEKMQS